MGRSGVSKGMPGYINHIKKDSLIKAAVGTAMFLCVYITCLLVFGTNRNYGTIMAVLIILPTAQMYTRYFGYSRYNSVSDDLAELLGGLDNVSVIYESIVIRGKKNYFLDAVVVTNEWMLLLVTDGRKLQKNTGRSDSDVDKTRLSKTRQEMQTLLNHKGIKVNTKAFADISALINYLDVESLQSVPKDKQVHDSVIKAVMGSAM